MATVVNGCVGVVKPELVAGVFTAGLRTLPALREYEVPLLP